MSWFSYLSNLDNPATPSYTQPPIRYALDIESPFYAVSQGSLFFKSLEFSDFYQVYSQSGSSVTDNTQYAVVYENGTSTPAHAVVRSNVKDGKLYFLAAENHSAGSAINDKYYIYAGNKYLKYVGATPSSTVTNYSKITDYRINQYNASTPLYETELYNLDLSNLDQYMVTVMANQNSSNQENFSYFNANTDWGNYKSSTIGAKVMANFTGPSLKLYAYKQTDGGKVKLTITKASNQIFDETTGQRSVTSEQIVVQDTYIDLYANNRSTELVYEKNDFDDDNYYFLIEIVNQDNRLSSGNLVEFHSFKYLRKHEISISEMEINPTIRFRSTGNTIL